MEETKEEKAMDEELKRPQLQGGMIIKESPPLPLCLIIVSYIIFILIYIFL